MQQTSIKRCEQPDAAKLEEWRAIPTHRSWLLTQLLTGLRKPGNTATGCCHRAEHSC